MLALSEAFILTTEIFFNFFKSFALHAWHSVIHKYEADEIDDCEENEGSIHLHAHFHVQVRLGGDEQEDVAHSS